MEFVPRYALLVRDQGRTHGGDGKRARGTEGWGGEGTDVRPLTQSRGGERHAARRAASRLRPAYYVGSCSSPRGANDLGSDSTRLDSTRLHSTALDCTRVRSSLFDSSRLDSTQFDSCAHSRLRRAARRADNDNPFTGIRDPRIDILLSIFRH